MDLNTLLAHLGEEKVSTATRPVSMPIYQASVFQLPGLDEVEAVYAGKLQAFLYSRDAHPNGWSLEQSVARLEGGESAFAAASGMAAIFAVLFAHLGSGDHCVATNQLYGRTYTLLSQDLPARGVQCTFVDSSDLAAVEAALRPNTKVIFVEAISNPVMQVADVPALARMARSRGALLVVDNTFATPYVLRPLEHGAHLSVTSATKFLNGHSDVTAGVAAGEKAAIEPARRVTIVGGGVIDPFAAWLTVRGMKTLALRLERQCANALSLARYLARHPRVEAVNYPGLPGHPQFALAQSLLQGRSGAMLSFAVGGGIPAADRFIRGLKLAQLVPSLGDVSTTVSHPATTSHRGFSPEQRAALGIPDGLIRISVGIEAVEAIIADVENALKHV